jgi:hypothetical protein
VDHSWLALVSMFLSGLFYGIFVLKVSQAFIRRQQNKQQQADKMTARLIPTPKMGTDIWRYTYHCVTQSGERIVILIQAHGPILCISDNQGHTWTEQ